MKSQGAGAHTNIISGGPQFLATALHHTNITIYVTIPQYEQALITHWECQDQVSGTKRRH